MVIVLNADNKAIEIGVFCDDKLIYTQTISSSENFTYSQYAVWLKQLFEMDNFDYKKIKGCIISSVVPNLTSVLCGCCHKLFGVEPIIVGAGIKTGLNIRLDNISLVGTDFICNCVGAFLYKILPLVIVDVGHVITISVLNEQGVFVGRTIFAGIDMQVNALYKNTAQLPKVSLEEDTNILGKNTADAMRSGILYGTASMISGMYDKIQKDYIGAKMILTGTNADIIKNYIDIDFILNKHLALEGLSEIYKKNKK